MDELWRALAHDTRAAPGLTVLLVLPAVLAVAPAVYRVRAAAVPFVVLLLQLATWYGFHLMGGWSDDDVSAGDLRLALAAPSVVTLCVALVGLSVVVGRVRAARSARSASGVTPRPTVTPRPLPPVGTP